MSLAVDDALDKYALTDALVALGRRAEHYADVQRCVSCFEVLGDRELSVCVYDAHLGHDHDPEAVVVGLTHTDCRASGVYGTNELQLERCTHGDRVRLGRREFAPEPVFVVMTMWDIVIVHPDGEVTESGMSGADSGLVKRDPGTGFDERIDASSNWWLDVTDETMELRGTRIALLRSLIDQLDRPEWFEQLKETGAALLIVTPTITESVRQAEEDSDTILPDIDLAELATFPPGIDVSVATLVVRTDSGGPPHRNDRCPCGSGRKFKACCAR